MTRQHHLFFPPFQLDLVNEKLFCGAQHIPLRPKALAVLRYLAEHAQSLVTKEELLEAVWRRSYVSEGLLRGYIRELRAVLGDEAQAPRFIETASRRGYRFIAPVTSASAVSSGGDQREPAFRATSDGQLWVGREAQLRRLQELWLTAQGGRRQIVFLTGEAGSGKTTFIEMFLETLARDEHRLMWGQCIEHYGAGEAFLPLLEALGREGDASRLKAALSACAPTWLSQLPRLLAAEEREEVQRQVLGATRERMLREGCELLEALSAEAPLVLVLEDMHWSDYATLDLLAALGRRRERAGLLVIVSYRASDAALRDHPLQRVRQELQARRLCAELPIDAFSRKELRAYLVRRFSQAPFLEEIARIIHRRTGGHPLFVVNLIDYLLADGRLRQAEGEWSIEGGVEDLERGVPDDIRELIEHQLERLSTREQQALGVASAAGMECSAALLAAALEEDPLAVEACCEALVRRSPMWAASGIAEWPDGTVAGNYAFRHALFAEVLYQRLTPAYRIALHRCLGKRLELAFGERSGEIAAELARHFEEGRDFSKALGYLRLAAEQSSRRFANREALNYLGRALALVDRQPVEARIDSRLSLMEQRALVHRVLSDWPCMVEDLEGLVALAGAEGRREQEVGGLIALTLALFHSDPLRCIATADLAVERSRDLAADRLRTYAVANQALFRLAFGLCREEDRVAVVHGAEVARSAQDAMPLALYCTLQTVMDLDQADYPGALRSAQEVLRLGSAMGDGFNYMSGQYYSAWALLHLGRWGEVRRIQAAGLTAAEQNDSPMPRSLFHLVAAALSLEALDYRSALTLCRSATPRPSDAYAVPLFVLLRSRAHLALGRYHEAICCLEYLAQMTEAGELLSLRNRMMLRESLGEYWLAMGKPAQAYTEAERLLELAATPGDRHFLALGHRLLARIAIAEQDRNEAECQLSQALAVIEGAVVPLAAWRVYFTAAELNEGQERTAEASVYWNRGAAVVRALADSLEETDPLRRSLLTALPVQEGA
ncbi:AAA family ATPase [Methylocaldum gracile]|jgi:DNA-binding winged helix-turn-helix (wHTH) protein/tetratricopeptide (TPR) repeat protein|uniref:AAA family ATPase n=1 Tax=unclassified Methylocaldum TaxID=2622260 RepID=UPI00105FF2F8